MFSIHTHPSCSHAGTSRFRTHAALQTETIRHPPPLPGVQPLARAVLIDALALALDLEKPMSHRDGPVVEWCRNVKAGQARLSVTLLAPVDPTTLTSASRRKLLNQYDALHWLAYGGDGRDAWVQLARVGTARLNGTPWRWLALLWELHYPSLSTVRIGDTIKRGPMPTWSRVHGRGWRLPKIHE